MLKDYIATKRKIVFEGGEFEVRGVCLADISGLITQHREAVDKIVAVMRAQQDMVGGDITAMIETVVSVISESPYLAADIISRCADEPDAYSSAFRLPLTVQIEAVRTIGDMTFADADALKKLIADVKRLLAGMLPAPEAAAA